MRTHRYISAYILLSLLLILSSPCYSNEISRQEVILKELDCIEKFIEEGELQWTDVCYTNQNVQKKAVVTLDEKGNVSIDGVYEIEGDEFEYEEDIDVELPEEYVVETEEDIIIEVEDDDEDMDNDLNRMYKAHSDYGTGRSFKDIADDHLEDDTMDLNQMYKNHNDITGSRNFEDLVEENEYGGQTDLNKMLENHTELIDGEYLDNTVDEDHEKYEIRKDRRLPSFYEFFNLSSPRSNLTLGLEAFSSTYREPGLMRQKAYMYGINADYTFKTSENRPIDSVWDLFSGGNGINVYKIELMGAYGEFDYESEGTGKDDDIPNYMFEGRGMIGYEIPMKSLTIMPFGGIGYRYLLDDGGGRLTTTGNWGYDRQSNYIYMPVGVSLKKEFIESWFVDLSVEYDIFLDGTQKSHLEDGGTGLDTLENDQDKGYGLRGSLKVSKTSEKIDFLFEPFVRYWNIEDSEIEFQTRNGQMIPVSGMPGYFLAGYEPNNNTTEYGVKISIRY